MESFTLIGKASQVFRLIALKTRLAQQAEQELRNLNNPLGDFQNKGFRIVENGSITILYFKDELVGVYDSILLTPAILQYACQSYLEEIMGVNTKINGVMSHEYRLSWNTAIRDRRT